MMEDEIVAEIHETRKRIFEECGNDIERFIERLKAADEQENVVSFEQVQQRARKVNSTE
jgi:hypothetical protein